MKKRKGFCALPLRFGQTQNGLGTESLSEDRLALPPLHALVQAGCYTPLVIDAIRWRPAATTSRDRLGRTVLAVAASVPRPCPLLLTVLLQKRHNWRAAAGMTDNNGRLPLNLAIEAGWDAYYLNKLCRAEPRAMLTRDITSRMYPFMMAAAATSVNVDSIYQVLRSDPSVIRVLGDELSNF